MLDRLKLPFYFDADRMKSEVELLSSWIDHFLRRNYEGGWKAIPLRLPRHVTGLTPARAILAEPECEDWVDSEFLRESHYFKEVLSAFWMPLHSVCLMKLTSGSVIKEHTDQGLDFEQGRVRLHIPVSTHDQVEFYLNDERVTMLEGECWYLRQSVPHRVTNHGPDDRIHLVIDGVVNDWCRQLFDSIADPAGSN